MMIIFINLTNLPYLGRNMLKIIGASKVTVRYQVTIPEGVRKKLDISVGDTLAFVQEDGKIYITTKA
jgi:AbrB family looped-hinge helix DNA binding protein